MSIEDRRNSIRKSSIGIDSIRKSISSLGDGLRAIAINSQELLKQTRKTNDLKRKIIKQDAEFFKKRRENALRKQREDELEASTITGVTKRQGSLVQKSTRGFLGRILDFVGILILGWALTNLPKIIATFQKLFGFIRRTVGILSAFVEGIKNFLVTLGTGIDNFLAIFNRFDFREDDKNIRETFEKTDQNLNKLDRDFVESVTSFAKDKDINSAGEVAKKLGLDDEDLAGAGEDENVPELKVGDLEDDGGKVVNQSQVDALNQGGTLDDEGNVVDAEGNLVEGVEAGAADLSLTEEEARQQIESEDAIQGSQTLSDENLVQPEVTDEDITEAIGDSSDVQGTGSEGTPSSVTPKSPSGSGLPSSDATPINLEPEEGFTNIEGMFDPVGSSDKSRSITPIKKNRENLNNSKKKKTTVIQVNNQGGMNNTTNSSMSGGTKTRVIQVGQSSEKTLLDLQSLNNKHN